MKMPKLPRKSRSNMIVGVAWYRETDWLRAKKVFPDADELHDSYAEWLKSAEDLLKHLKSSGVAAEPYVMDIGDFLGWCLVHGRQPPCAVLCAPKCEARDTLDLIGRIRLCVGGALGAVLFLRVPVAKVNPAGQLAHNLEINRASSLWLQRRNPTQRLSQANRAQVDVQPQFLAQCQQPAFGVLSSLAACLSAVW